jgi:uridine kinase
VITFSVSTWRQPMPPAPSAERARVLERIVEIIDACGDGQLRVCVDGRTASGKTSLGHELARGLAERGRPVLRASLDDFKRPWRERHLYDRESGEGYYRNAFDYLTVRRLLLEPTDRVALCSIDPITQVDHSRVTTVFPANGVLVVDGVFACRPELDGVWDLRIWLDIDAELSVRRGGVRDGDEHLHRVRYLPSELLYVAEADPTAHADVLVDNTSLDRPGLVREPGTVRGFSHGPGSERHG